MGKASDLEKSAAAKKKNGDNAGAAADFEKAGATRRNDGELGQAAADFQWAFITNLAAGQNQQAVDDAGEAGDALRNLAKQETGRDAALDFGKAALLYEDAGALQAALNAAQEAVDEWKADAAAHEDNAEALRKTAEIDRKIAATYDKASDPKRGNPNAAAFDEKTALWLDQAKQHEDQAIAELQQAAHSFEYAASVIMSMARIEGAIAAQTARTAKAKADAQKAANVKAKKAADGERAKKAAAEKKAKAAEAASKKDAEKAQKERDE